MARPRAKELTERELEVMHAFWQLGESTVAEVRDCLAEQGRDLAYTTVATLVRILTEKDFLKTTLSSGYHGEPGGRVSDYMTADVETVPPDMNLFELIDLFLNSNYHRFPVVLNSELVGFISRRDVLKAMFNLSWQIS